MFVAIWLLWFPPRHSCETIFPRLQTYDQTYKFVCFSQNKKNGHALQRLQERKEMNILYQSSTRHCSSAQTMSYRILPKFV